MNSTVPAPDKPADFSETPPYARVVFGLGLKLREPAKELVLGAPCFYLSGSPSKPSVVDGIVTWLGTSAVRIADPLGVRFLPRTAVYPTAQEALGAL
jgi:hypothetical protein